MTDRIIRLQNCNLCPHIGYRLMDNISMAGISNEEWSIRCKRRVENYIEKEITKIIVERLSIQSRIIEIPDWCPLEKYEIEQPTEVDATRKPRNVIL